MKKAIITISILCILLIAGLSIKNKLYNSTSKEIQSLILKEEIHDGDIIFQVSLSSQSKAIQQATKSKYSHCGIIYKDKGKYYVYEAVQPVKLTPLKNWIARGKGEHFVVKRLRDADKILTPVNLAKMKKEGEKFRGRNYDLTFEWSDDKIYCSELVWKIYKRATGLEVGKLQTLGEFDLTSDIVREKLKERYGNKLPKDEIVISPASIYESDLLITVASN